MVEGDIKQNYAVDIYQEYFSGEYVDHSSEAPSAKTLSVFKDPSEVKRTVSNISWYPDGGKKLAVAFAIMQFQDARMEQAQEFSYIWDVNNPNTPELQLTPSHCAVWSTIRKIHTFSSVVRTTASSRASTRAQARRQRDDIIEVHRDPVYRICWPQGGTRLSAHQRPRMGRCCGGMCAN